MKGKDEKKEGKPRRPPTTIATILTKKKVKKTNPGWLGSESS